MAHFLLVHLTLFRLTTHNLEHILTMHITLNTWPLTQRAVPHTMSHSLLERDINTDRQKKAKEAEKEERHKISVYCMFLHLIPLTFNQCSLSPLSHCGNYVSDYLLTIISLYSPFTSSNWVHITFCRHAESDHKLALVFKKSHRGKRWKLPPLFHVLSFVLCLCQVTAQLCDLCALCCVWQRSNKLSIQMNWERGRKSNYNLLLIPGSSKSQRFSLSLLTSPP